MNRNVNICASPWSLGGHDPHGLRTTALEQASRSRLEPWELGKQGVVWLKLGRRVDRAGFPRGSEWEGLSFPFEF